MKTEIKLTPEQRLEAYNYALNKIKNNEYCSYSICAKLSRWLSINVAPISEYNGGIFYEFDKRMPDTIDKFGLFWFDSALKQPRIDLLNECIKEVKEIIKELK